MTTALIFPGQGSQTVGMGKELYDNFAVAREVFNAVDAALGEKLSDIIFFGPQETLTLTQNAQPAIMATSIAALRVLTSETDFKVSDASFVAGHSLGEYSALCAAGAISLEQTARLLRVRGNAMQQSVPAGKGAMAALIGVDLILAETIVKEAAQDSGVRIQDSGSKVSSPNPESRIPNPSEVCSIANDNGGGQVVISGARAAVERAVEIAKAKSVKRAVMLDVSAPFHCALMAPAAGVMDAALKAATIHSPIIPVVANVTAAQETDPETIRQLLVDQVTGMVRWRESMHYLKSKGVTKAIEIGAGKVLAGLMKRIEPEITVTNVATPADVKTFAKVE